MRSELGRLEVTFEKRFGELLKWSLVFWVTTLATLVATIVTLARYAPSR